jgi:hypothetical protein
MGGDTDKFALRIEFNVASVTPADAAFQVEAR